MSGYKGRSEQYLVDQRLLCQPYPAEVLVYRSQVVEVKLTVIEERSSMADQRPKRMRHFDRVRELEVQYRLIESDTLRLWLSISGLTKEGRIAVQNELTRRGLSGLSGSE